MAGQHGHVLDLDLVGAGGRHGLQVAHDLLVEQRDQDPALVDVGVERGRRVLGQFEQRPQGAPVSVVRLDARLGRDGRRVGHLGSAHFGSFTRMARV